MQTSALRSSLYWSLSASALCVYTMAEIGIIEAAVQEPQPRETSTSIIQQYPNTPANWQEIAF